MLRLATILGCVTLWSLLVVPTNAADGVDGAKVRFKKTQIEDKFRSEGVSVGDFNHDGKQDISAGQVVFLAPDWKLKPIAESPQEYDPLKYSNSFCNWADDINGDGWTDLLVVDFPGKETWWLENPKGFDRPWPRHVCTSVTNNESPGYLDVDGDGQRELVLGFAPTQEKPDAPERRMGIVRRGKPVDQPWPIQAISESNTAGTQRFAHGLGVGDVNRDGRNDVIIPQGWWEAPSKAGGSDAWKFHEVKFSDPAVKNSDKCAQMLVYDFDGDGDNDVLATSAHELGMWWHEQKPDGWEPHDISQNFSQTHSVCLADINGDGLMDFVTGKRWWAHGPKGDKNPGDPPVLFWFELTRKDGKPVWIPHQIDDASGVGTQFEVADVNGDGLLDIAISNKRGTFLFEQERK